MGDYCKKISSKNKRAKKSFKCNYAKFMAKFRDVKNTEWYLTKDKLLKPHVGSLYSKLPGNSMFLLEKKFKILSKFVSYCDFCH